MGFSLLQRTTACFVGAAVVCICATSAMAQYYYPYPPTYYGPPQRVYAPPPPGYGAPGMLPPGQVRNIVANLGYWKVGQPSLSGRTYFVSAVAEAGPVMLSVDAFNGRTQPIGPAAPPQGWYRPPYGAPPPGALAARTPPAAPISPVIPLPRPRPQDIDVARPETAPNTIPATAAVTPAPAAAAALPAVPATLPAATPPAASSLAGAPPAQAKLEQPQGASAPVSPAAIAPTPSEPTRPTGAGTATPADGVSAGTASVISRTPQKAP